MTGRFRPKRYGDGPVTGHRQPNTQLFTREHDNDLANKSHRLDRLTAVLGRPEAIFAALIATLALAARSSGKVVSAVRFHRKRTAENDRRGYSLRSATVGSTAAALRAGK